ncbi:MAG: 3'-5' exonuclease, partial [Eubacteriales bacterium]|nr:3'-5' exonuclease [Eubacteriales bacterium]
FSEIDISLLTFHASKGLEFDVVYIISADEGITPGKLSGGTGSGSSSPFTHPDAAALEEERRLFYVAMTRAKKVLHISNTNFVYNKRHKRSRFVNELKLPVFFG